MKMPVLFVGHGSPMNALTQNALADKLNELGQTMPRPQAILCVSAHWETSGTHVLHQAFPPTIHDFYGFPKPLFEKKYPAPGAPKVAEETQKLIPGAQLSEKWGLDHGAWSVLVHLYPKADVPVFQLSIDMIKTPEEHLAIGTHIQALREKGVLILGSGNIVHNLRAIQWNDPHGAYPWAAEFDQGIEQALRKCDTQTLTHYEEKFGQSAKLSVPTPEHFYPLLYCLGATSAEDKISFPYEGYEFGSLSMRSVLWQS